MFERIFDGLQSISKGDIIRLNTKPAILGRVSSCMTVFFNTVPGDCCLSCKLQRVATDCALLFVLRACFHLHTPTLQTLVSVKMLVTAAC